MKRKRKTIEQKIMEEEGKRRRKRERTENKALREIPKPVKPEPTEEEIVRKYVKRVIKNTEYHGRIKGHTKTVNKNLWLDTDFFFSVVFQSAAQKYAFLKALPVPSEENEQVQIINGMELAKTMGISLEKETRSDYPLGSTELMDFVLDAVESDSEYL